MNKKGIDLSINMIIIIILAVVTLVAALGFITGVLPPLLNIINYPKLVENPSYNNPLTFNPVSLVKGKNTGMSIGFYNNEEADIANTVIPTITCSDITGITVKAEGLTVPVGEWKQYEAVVFVPKNTPSKLYPCVLKLSKTEKAFTMDVK